MHKGEEGNEIHREERTRHLGETLGVSSLEGKIHLVSLPHLRDCYINTTPFLMA